MNHLLFVFKIEYGSHCFFKSDKNTAYYLFGERGGANRGKRSEYLTALLNGVSIEWMSQKREITGIVEIELSEISKVTPFIECLGLGGLVGDAVECVLIPFKLRDVDLGFFILWGNLRPDSKEMLFSTFVRDQLSNWYFRLCDILTRFNINSHTFLPLHRPIGWKWATIMFLDIRNFTTLTEILRNRMNLHKDINEGKGTEYKKENENGILNKIVKEFCQEMCGIVHENSSGRVDKFMGDGILVIFGETEDNPSKIVTEALDVAVKMVKKFAQIKKGWQKQAFGDRYDIEFNESVDIDLGIGIDSGTVLFDYLGDGLHKEYSVVGDHVNFASRLQGVGARIDEKTGMKRPPIILSSTSYRCCKAWILNKGKKVSEMYLDLKGKSHQYKCFGLHPDGFDTSHYKTSKQHDDWKTPWEEFEDGPPLKSS